MIAFVGLISAPMQLVELADEQVSLHIGDGQVPVPEPLGQMLLDLVERCTNTSTVNATVTLQTDAEGFLQQIRELATDCVNQGGVPELVAMKTTMNEPFSS